MPAEQKSKMTNTVVYENDRLTLEPERFVPVAIPEKLNQSRNLKADLEAYDIPVQLGLREAEMDAEILGGVPVLVPEGAFEQASEIISLIELNAIDDEDEFEEFEEFEDEEEPDEEWEEEEEEEEEEEYEDEDEDLDFDDDFEDEDEDFGFDDEE